MDSPAKIRTKSECAKHFGGFFIPRAQPVPFVLHRGRVGFSGASKRKLRCLEVTARSG